MLSQHADSSRSISLRSKVHRCHTGRCELVRVSTRIKHRLHHFEMTTAACKMQWCVAPDPCRRLHSGASVEQELRHLKVVIESRPVQRGESVRLRSVHILTLL